MTFTIASALVMVALVAFTVGLIVGAVVILVMRDD